MPSRTQIKFYTRHRRNHRLLQSRLAEDLPYRHGCCSPIPGDPIVGHVSSGRGLVIHTENCRNVEELRNNPEKCVILSWDKDISSEFTVDLKVYMENRRGIIVEVASAINQADANIEKISVEEKDARLSVTNLKISIQGRKHLARTIRRLRTIRGVNKIVRIKQ